MAPTLLLDLDGTLVDSAPDLAASLNRVIAPANAPFTPAEIAPMIGDGAGALARRAMAARGVAENPTLAKHFAEDYGAHAAELTKPYPGVLDGMRALQAAGWRLAVCTNKPVAAAHGLGTLALAGGTASAAVALGDHRNDIQAARGAGLPCIFAAWGYGAPEMADGAAAVAQRFADVQDIAQRLLAARL